MPTHAELAGRLLLDAASFFRTLAGQNESLKKQMSENAIVFEQMANLITRKPEGAIGDKTHAEMASQLLIDASGFFRTLAEQNEPIKEQMEENAEVYLQISALVKNEPLGILD